MANHFSTPFGIGILSVTPSGSNVTPLRIAVVKDVSVKTTTDFEELYGEEIDPIDVADKSRSTEITCKASGYNSLLFSVGMGGTPSVGSVLDAKDEDGTIPSPSGPYTIDTTHKAVFSQNVGVIDTTAGSVMSCGGTASGAGVYAISSGVYTFNAADAGHTVKMSYLYTDASNGHTVAIGGSLAGAGSRFRLDLFRTYGGNSIGFTFPAVAFGGMSHSMGGQKHGEIDLTFRAYKDPTTGKLVTVYSSK